MRTPINLPAIDKPTHIKSPMHVISEWRIIVQQVRGSGSCPCCGVKDQILTAAKDVFILNCDVPVTFSVTNVRACLRKESLCWEYLDLWNDAEHRGGLLLVNLEN
ncbi:hypothetical protein WICPIJ_002458 [Wickerhamomyces pijperi]|uniref:Uncharacterized protein n=1 Tax=Wickerhamomyces pijperi TaxID=599730 RepID=A0A9P8QBQ0_WICPI|nr:hypothetical protein WICPIJ_002458 [Wickerhamomyces pijperi]